MAVCASRLATHLQLGYMMCPFIVLCMLVDVHFSEGVICEILWSRAKVQTAPHMPRVHHKSGEVKLKIRMDGLKMVEFPQNANPYWHILNRKMWGVLFSYKLK